MTQNKTPETVCVERILSHPKSYSAPGHEQALLLNLMTMTVRMRRIRGARWRTMLRALELWLSLPSDYERGQLLAWGTAFTTWEDHGPAVCGYLNGIAAVWKRGL